MAFFALVAALGARASAGSGQDPLQPAPIFKTKVDLVRVDVSVIGRRDEVVADLQASDFSIEEDRVAQKLETLQFIRLDGTRTSDIEESLEIRSPEHAALEAARDDVRLFAIFLDDYHVEKAPQITLPLRRALKELIQQFGPNDLIALMDPLTPLSHLRFTRSRDELLTRVDKFEGRRGQLTPVRSLLEEGQLTQRNVWELRGGVTLSALHALVTHLGGLREGRKSVLFVSQGPPLGPIGGSNRDRLDEVLQAANRGNVTIHVFDPRPLGSSPLGGSDAVHRLYSETGGRAILNTNAPAERLPLIIADASAYYLLGYSPSRGIADGKFHRIDVKVNRRGVRILARRGYWAPSPEEMTPAVAPAPTEPGLAEALVELVQPKDGRALDVWVGASRGPGTLTRLTVSWEPAARTDALRPTRLLVERFVEDGATFADSQSIASASASHGGPTTATFDVEAGGNIKLRFSAQAADGTLVDQWDQSMTVPSLTRQTLALGTPRFLRARSAFEARAIDNGHDPAPAASRRFRSTDRVLVDVDCYAPDDEVPTISAQLLNGKGEPLMALTVPPVAAGRTRFTLPLSSLAPSTYVLRVDARAGGHDVQQRSAFQLIP